MVAGDEIAQRRHGARPAFLIPLLVRLSRDKVVPIHGLNYKDRPQDAERWLNELGDPYVRTGADVNGRVGIDWGVYGVPETFVIDAHGVIRKKYVGPLTSSMIKTSLIPLIDSLRGGKS